MATVVTDTLGGGGVSMVEEGGVVKELRRSVLVHGLTGSDWTKLQDALDEAGVPAFGDIPASNQNLVLIKRDVKSVSESTDAVRVMLTYVSPEYAWDSGLDQDNALGWTFRGGTSLQQTQSQNDAFGNQIVLSHTYPSTDEKRAGETVEQGGTVSILRPISVLTATGPLSVAYPDYIHRDWTSYINSDIWAGCAAYTWICSNVTWNPLNMTTSPPTWRFEFEFQHDPTGWQPYVVFTDPDTKKPVAYPSGSAAGYVTSYAWRPFNDLFPI